MKTAGNLSQYGRQPGSQADPEDLRIYLRSAIRGRERWDVRGIYRRPRLASYLERTLAGHPGMVSVAANAVTGRVLLVYEPDLLPDSEAWLGTCLEKCLTTPEVVVEGPAAEVPPRDALLRILQISLPDSKAWVRPSFLSVLAKSLELGLGLSFVATVNAARGNAPAFLRTLGMASSGASLTFMGALSLALVAVNTVVQPLCDRAWTQLATSAELNLRARLFAQIQRQDIELFNRQGTGHMIQLVASDTEKIADFVGDALDQVLQKVVVFGISATGLLFTSPLLALVVCLPLPLLSLPPTLLGRRVKEAYNRLGDSDSSFSETVEDSLSGIADVKSFGAERHEAGRLRRIGEDVARDMIDSQTLSAFQAQLSDSMVQIGLHSAAAFAGSLAVRNRIEQSSYTTSLYLIPRLLSVPAGLGKLTGLYNKAAHASQRMLEALNAQPKIRSGPHRLPKAEGSVVFDNVVFGYGSSPMLQGISFQLEPGQTLAIVGPTGSGKSTLLRLLLRFYDVQGGRILVDGTDIRDLDLRDLRKAISLVQQDIYLFDDSLRENVRFGRRGASDGDVLEALRRANALDVVNNRPDGLDSEVGTRGRRLSGGERQRVAIARALLKNSAILALDEATSSLDYATEAAIQRSVREGSANRSVIIVAHRLASIRHADHIIVLENGRIREAGRHTKLVRSAGLYSALWKLQSGESPYGAELELRLARPPGDNDS